MTTNNLYNTVSNNTQLSTTLLNLGKEIEPNINNLVDTFIVLGFNVVLELISIIAKENEQKP